MADPQAWRRFWKTPAAIISLAILVFVVVAAVMGPFFLPASYARPSELSFSPPTNAHPFGTDLNGRDILYRVMTGGQVSLLVGCCGALVSLLIGTAYGMLSGYIGGKTDFVLMRVVDVLFSIPRLIFILICINSFSASLQNYAASHDWQTVATFSRLIVLIISLGIIEWLTLARIVRGQTLALKSRAFVTAAKALGQSHGKILLRHLLPNLAGVILIYLTLTIPAVVIGESFLSFLGLGIQAPQASWGSLLADGASALNPLKIRWWLVLFPAMAMAITLLSLNILGDALRDALDPRRS